MPPVSFWSRPYDHSPPARQTGDPYTRPGELFPFDGAGRLAGDVHHDPRDIGDLVGDPRGDLLQDVVGQPRPVRGHRVLARHRAQHHRVAVRAPVTLHTHRPDVGQQHYGELPDVAVESGLRQFVAGDRVGAAQDVQPIPRDGADDADGETGAGERVPPDDLCRQPELLAQCPYLVLEQRPQRLDQLEPEVVGEPADVVVRLDVGR